MATTRTGSFRSTILNGPPPGGDDSSGPPDIRWHRPLLWLALAMAALAVVAVVGLVVDPRTVTGAPLWAKPFKFAISVAIYAVTLSWLIGLLPGSFSGRRRLAWWAGTVATVFLLVEMVIIVGAAATGLTSHFNVSTPFAAVLWSVMAASIVTVWVAAVPIAILLLRTDLGDPARALAIRAGLLIALLGMALAFLMTGPTAAQLDDYQGIVGAHTVGVADGGPGLPLVGWSTVAGDLRIPHFVGMHALQVLPLAALLLEVLARRMPALGRPLTRRGVLRVLVGLYLGVLVLLTGQALAGQSIVQPSPLVAGIAAALPLTAAVAITVTLRRHPSPRAA
ncbi:hypothetical protein [Cryobacterium arcticum]|uniref:Uncharacterized protein n=1 Tax=Cryobacterium arcticum TaxID=670052 RepID=A0A317ZTM1_9MICO|nr:hypothetical protein [Cryobacterium arcticum]PXA68145.1 hypothetical protein CTB96_16090 [Cryobacterium arcticum]